MDRLEAFTEAIDSVLAQTYRSLEVVIVIDGNPTLYDRIVTMYGEDARVRVELNSENRGISYSRNRGAELATGEVVAFIDDDAVAEKEWIAEHVKVYKQTNAVATAGPVVPAWVDGEPAFFPAEFYWLVGCTEPAFAEDGEEIRNGYGSNVSYQREVFLTAGGYDVNTGRRGDLHIQAHEAPLGVRLESKYGRRVTYTTNPKVQHMLFNYRAKFSWLLYRSFYQGYSKRIMKLLYPVAAGQELKFLSHLMKYSIPSRIKDMAGQRTLSPVAELVALLAFTAAVGLGYIWGVIDISKADLT
jgi:glycosyltransferase involved in cell wall biosynthesis